MKVGRERVYIADVISIHEQLLISSTSQTITSSYLKQDNACACYNNYSKGKQSKHNVVCHYYLKQTDGQLSSNIY